MKTKTQLCKFCTIFGEGPCSPKCLADAEEKAARAIHAEHNRHEGLTTHWIDLYGFQRMKYRAKAYAVLRALGAPEKKASICGTPQHNGTTRENVAKVDLDRCLRAVDDEPELPGEIPEVIWTAIHSDRAVAESAFRAAVRSTKDGIRKRIIDAAVPFPKPKL